jgi:YVTN family beta-propeller protein
MNSKKTRVLSLILTLILFAFAGFYGCSDNNSTEPETKTSYKFGNGLIVMCEGNSGANNSTITYKSFANDSLYQDVFVGANGSKLGDCANHIAVKDGKAYIVVSNSNKIEVVSLENFKTTKTIALDADAQPRSIAVFNDYAYVSSYKGLVYKIGLSDGAVKSSIAVGAKPEGVAEANGKIFVCNSGWGYDSTVSVIDVSTGAVTKSITVGVNPQYIVKGNDGYVYAVGGGSYSNPAAKSGLWKIDASTLKVVDIIELSGNPGKVCNYKNNTLLLTNSQGAYVIDPSAKTKKLAIPMSQVNSTSAYGMIYAISYDGTRDEIYCGNPKDYKQNGEIIVIKEESGSFVTKSSFSCGISPSWVIVVR